MVVKEEWLIKLIEILNWYLTILIHINCLPTLFGINIQPINKKLMNRERMVARQLRIK
ncbi:unnamed protein product [Paramecium octaurelia]|uniref:Uncharacterized protein n=1 Tax=Paramecium octaurelia TaxID=43137 RepID=A0A8S1WYE5_PAROT|nr:unnamed protein product [Paramecium octaurelia]